jgi:hypothetical protein
VVGKEHRALMARIRQYKQLFSKELKTFKIKKNPSTQELQQYLDEIQGILETQTQDTFQQEAIFHVLGLMEGVSTRFPQYNLTGLTALLKGNTEFNNLVRILAIKYGNTFSSVPPEYQFVLVLASSCYIVINQNRMNSRLEEAYVLPQSTKKETINT